MESRVMKITKLTIKNLHGHNNYDVDFNSDITFLYGDNGCGKTTILNIVTFIITGSVYKLYDYKFDEITLTYQPTDSKIHQRIVVSINEDNEMLITFASKTAKLEPRIEYISRASDEREDLNRLYFSEYPILEEIKNTFNYVYLPLNRNSSLSLEHPYAIRSRKMAQLRYNHTRGRYSESRADPTLYEVEALVASAFNKATLTLNRINEEFSDSILKAFLDVEDIISTDKIVQYMLSLNVTKIKQMQAEYIKVLKTLDKWDDTSKSKVNSFFDSLQRDINANKNNKNNVNIEFFFKLSEVSKITNIIDKAEAAENAKKEARRPIDTFLSTVNSFIATSNKEIDIDEEGVIFLRTGDQKPIGIQHMSSGEKQIVTFFAYLVFGLETTNQSIFIVDEPELSLHLKWQRQFVDAIMEINSNVQLIFATHAPEIIGRHRIKAVKLIPEAE